MKSSGLRGIAVGAMPALAIVLLHPGTAGAAVTGLEANVTAGVLSVTSGGGLADKVNVLGPLAASGGTYIAVVSDDAGQVVPGTGCEAVDRYQIVCDAPAITRIEVSSGAGNDRVVTDVTIPVTVHGGDGDDQLTDRAGGNELSGDTGSDWLYGGAGDDRLSGGDGGDQIHGEAGDDTMDGGAGTDFFVAGFDLDGTDVLRGGDGDDYADYSRRSAPVTVTLDGIADDGSAGENDVLSGIESVRAGSGDDRLAGDDEANTLDGGAGNDRIVGLGGDDSLYGDRGDDAVEGGAGADSLAGGLGRDTVLGGAGDDYLSVGEHPGEGLDLEPDRYDGGAGRDRLSYSWTSRAVTVTLDGLANDGKAGENDNAVAIEDISGTNYDDVLIGDGGDNRITGEAGKDVIDGGAGVDDLNGGPGRDTLRSVDGAGSRDRVEGGYPWDTRKDDDTCEADADDLVFACANEVIVQP
ncbi:calcium-binding protein [Actinoplanes subglobosus]|uniref:Calcium-binding protein n=1 Tax=Actinoplanes subglobosus TaxID=1547892 RepID=A0ABV8J0J9_9ACTN